MIVPGGNIFNLAMTVINRQKFTYFAALMRTLAANGLYTAQYSAGVETTGSVQPVPRSLYAQYGLDFQRSYFTFYVSKNIIDVKRDVSGDKFVYANRNFQCLSITEWFTMDGWDAVLTVEVPDA